MMKLISMEDDEGHDSVMLVSGPVLFNFLNLL